MNYDGVKDDARTSGDQMVRAASCAAGDNQPTNSMPIISPTDTGIDTKT